MAMLQPQLNFQESLTPEWISEEVSTGTTIMAAVYDGGVIIGADSRTTSGSYIANRVTDKLTKISDKIYCCRSGSAADTQAIADIVAYHLELMSIELGEEPSVRTAANIFKDLCYNYRDSLLAGIICAGYDAKNKGQVYSIDIGGMCQKKNFTMGGSGSTFVYGYVDSHFKPNMSKEECVDFIKHSVALAMFRDGSSGGVIRIGIINEQGVERRLYKGDEVPKFYEDNEI